MPSTRLDAVTVEILSSRLREIIATMEWRLFHSGYSTVLREAQDGSAGITDRFGRVVAASGLPIHIPPYHRTVQAILEQWPVRELHDGDSFVLNDPYSGGVLHVLDVAVVTPIFVDSHLLGFSVSIAHKPDLGGTMPRGSGAQDVELCQEGLLIPGVRLWSSSGPIHEIERLISRNSRVPEVIAGDLRAQVGCTKVGADKVRELCREYGRQTIANAFGRLQDLAELRMRTRLGQWADGTSEAEAWVDDDVADRRTRLHVTVEKRRDAISFDLGGSGVQQRTSSNLRPQAVESAVLLALLAFLDPSIPINDGCQRVITIVNPSGLITNAAFPASVQNYYGVLHLLYSCVLRALAPFDPDRAVGCAGLRGSGVVSVHYGTNDGLSLVQYEILVPSLGATPSSDGSFAVMPLNHITPNTPIEVLETEFPIRVACLEPIMDTAGPGRHRGGVGYRKRYRLLQDAEVTCRFSQSRSGAWGIMGGGDSNLVACSLDLGDGGMQTVTPQFVRELPAGTEFELVLPGGGGYGDPRTRDVDRVLDDVLDGYVSAQAAEITYGVLVDEQRGIAHEEATRRPRSS